MAIPVTYYYVDLYLSSLRYFESLDIELLYSGLLAEHAGRGSSTIFISESRRLVDRAILASLAKQRPGLTLKELIDGILNAVGDWPHDSWTVAMFAVRTHGSTGTVEQSPTNPRVHPARWEIV